MITMKYREINVPTDKGYECVVKPRGGRQYYYNGKLHRLDGPAYIRANGDGFWYRHGQRHRDGGSAMEWVKDPNQRHYYRNGKEHREDGPAVENRSGKNYFALRGKRMCLDKFLKKTPASDEEKMFVKLRYG